MLASSQSLTPFMGNRYRSRHVYRKVVVLAMTLQRTEQCATSRMYLGRDNTDNCSHKRPESLVEAVHMVWVKPTASWRMRAKIIRFESRHWSMRLIVAPTPLAVSLICSDLR
jgi:hypothetical protein